MDVVGLVTGAEWKRRMEEKNKRKESVDLEAEEVRNCEECVNSVRYSAALSAPFWILMQL